MPSTVLADARALRDALVGFDPALCSGEDCAVVVEELAAMEKACAAARALAAARAADCGAHRQKGFADAADWVARARGTSTVEAKTELETVKALRGMPDTRTAVAAGELSLAQAHELVRTETECPGSEGELLAVARGGSLKNLKDMSPTPTGDPPPTTTSGPAATPTARKRPPETARPASSKAGDQGPTHPDRPPARGQARGS